MASKALVRLVKTGATVLYVSHRPQSSSAVAACKSTMACGPPLSPAASQERAAGGGGPSAAAGARRMMHFWNWNSGPISLNRTTLLSPNPMDDPLRLQHHAARHDCCMILTNIINIITQNPKCVRAG